jgi:GT2 family glycosyltransferase
MDPESPQSLIQFSVIIPTYHRNDLLSLCLERLAPGQQTLSWSAYEVIVSDDGSTSTAQKLIQENFPWAKWIAGPRQGAGANRNHGASYSRGEWLVFTDDDCLPSLEWLGAFAAAVQSGIHVYEGCTTCEAGVQPPMEVAPINLEGGFLWSCNMMISRQLFQRLGGFDPKFPYPHMEDVEFRERLQMANESFLFVPKAIVDHPPRLIQPPKKMAAYQESLYYYFAKRKVSHQKSVQNIFYATIISRLIGIKKNPFTFGSLLGLINLLQQLFYLTLLIPSWKSKYSDYHQSSLSSLSNTSY